MINYFFIENNKAWLWENGKNTQNIAPEGLEYRPKIIDMVGSRGPWEGGEGYPTFKVICYSKIFVEMHSMKFY